MNLRLLYLFITAALVRFIGINQSYWLDEATSVQVVKKLSAVEILSNFSVHDFHPPLYYLFLDLWTSLFGYSETATRLPSILFILIAGYLVYKIALMWNKDIAFWAALLFLFNPLVMYYSQETRMYAMVTALVTGALYFFLHLLKNHQGKKERNNLSVTIFLCNLCIFLSFLTFYGSVFFIAAMYLLLIVKKKYQILSMLLPGFFVSVAVVYPLLSQQLANSGQALQAVKNWNLVLGIPTVKNLVLIPLKFTIGRISFDPKIVYYAISGLASAITFFFIARGGYKQRSLLFLFVAPLFTAFFFSFQVPLLQYFRFLFLIPVMALILAYGTRVFPWERYIVITIFVVASLAYLIYPGFHREDWKHVLISVPESSEVYMIPASSDPIQHYYPHIPTKNLLAIQTDKPNSSEIYIIPYAAEIYGFAYAPALEQQGYKMVEQQNYQGVILQIWQQAAQSN